MDTKIRLIYMLSIRDPFQTQEHIQTESERMEKDSMQIEMKRKLEWQYSSDQTDFKDCYKRQRHYIMIKGSIQEDITV